MQLNIWCFILRLDFNDFGDQEISELAQAMRSNSTIGSLW